MDRMTARRGAMAALGAVAGLSLYGLAEVAGNQIWPERVALAALVFCGTFFGTLLAMAGPLRPGRAAVGAFAIAAVLMVLMALSAFRFDSVRAFLNAPHLILAAAVVATVPMPFWIAASLSRWNDYRILFGESWSIVVRYGVAWAFAGVVWSILFLSDALLSVVGLSFISDLLEIGAVPWLVTGVSIGLALAVVQELQDYVSPYLILRMLRLILPVVFLVTAIFLLALPLRGFAGLLPGISTALILLCMAGAGATLVTTVVDQEDAQAADSRILIWSAKGISLLLPVLAGIGAWAIGMRVAQYGWSPDRIFAAEIAALGIGYGGLYAVAVLHGPGWEARIRRANIWMATAVTALAAISLTPLLNAEAISARSHLTRYLAGDLPLDRLDPLALGQWGRPGAEALDALRGRAAEPGQEALAARLADPTGLMRPTGDLLAELRAALPLQPANATATRDLFLELYDADALRDLLASCRQTMPGGGPGCVMVVADLLPDTPGEEALLAQWRGAFFVQFTGLVQGRDRFEPIVRRAGGLPDGAEAADLIRYWQAAPPALEPARVNRLSGSGIMVLE